MSMNDTVADFLTRVRNGFRAEHEDVTINYTVLVENIAKVMRSEGYIKDFQTVGEGAEKVMIVKLKYVNGTSVIANLQRVSKPSRRVYVGYNDVKPIMNGLGLSILSTPAGVMSDNDARKKHVGGEVLCNVW